MALDQAPRQPNFVLLCQQCHGAIGLSPCDWFCNQDCQANWAKARIGELEEPIAKVVQFPPIRIPPDESLEAQWGMC